MRYNLKYIIIGIVCFIFAVTTSSVIGTIVNAVIPNPNKPDPEGKLDPDPQEKSKAEWLQQLEGGGAPAETKETKAEPQQPKPEQQPQSEQQPQQFEQPAQQPTPLYRPADPAPAPVYRTPKVGPGNFDAPTPYNPPPAPRTGPGNM